MTTHKRICQRSFTLVEMLVVMAIIAILAAVLLPAIRAAVSAAKNNRIAQELSSLHQAVEAYKTKFGDYPPDFSSIRVVADLSDTNNILVRHLRKAFPRHTENLATVFAPGGTLNVPLPSEALVFWLSLLKNDPRQPLTSTTAEKHVIFSFDEARVKDLRGKGWYSYLPKDGKDAPYIYFDSRTYQFIYGGNLIYSSFKYDTVNNLNVCPYEVNTTGTTGYANPKTFQIICAGLDGDYGTTTLASPLNPVPANPPLPTTYKIFPIGTNYILADMDNITNFSEGKILEDHMP